MDGVWHNYRLWLQPGVVIGRSGSGACDSPAEEENSKPQAPSTREAPSIKPQARPLSLGAWSFPEAWSLEFEALSSSINDFKIAITSSHSGGKAPDREPFLAADRFRRFPLGIEKLPGNCPTLLPAGAFGPDQQRFPARVSNGDRMLLPAASGCNGDRRAEVGSQRPRRYPSSDFRPPPSGLAPVNRAEPNAPHGFPSGNGTVRSSRAEPCRTHRTGRCFPRMNVEAAECFAPVA